MSSRIDPLVRADVLQLREAGHSLATISKETLLPRSTVQYIVDGMRLSAAGRKAVAKMQRAAAQASLERAAAVRHRPRSWTPSEEHRTRLSAAALAGRLLWRADELDLRARVEEFLRCTLRKEWATVGGRSRVIKVAVSCQPGDTDTVVDWARTKSAASHLPERVVPCSRSVVWMPSVLLGGSLAARLGAELRPIEELL